jgi:di- and tripeptidase
LAEISGHCVPAMDPTELHESDSTSEIDEQTRTWESDPRSITAHLANDDANHPNAKIECGIGHRVQASRSVLALVLDDECVFAGLQGGDIIVRDGLVSRASFSSN